MVMLKGVICGITMSMTRNGGWLRLSWLMILIRKSNFFINKRWACGVVFWCSCVWGGYCGCVIIYGYWYFVVL